MAAPNDDINQASQSAGELAENMSQANSATSRYISELAKAGDIQKTLEAVVAKLTSDEERRLQALEKILKVQIDNGLISQKELERKLKMAEVETISIAQQTKHLNLQKMLNER